MICANPISANNDIMKQTPFAVLLIAIFAFGATNSFAQIKTVTNSLPAQSSSSWQNVKTNAAQSWYDIKQTLGASADYTFEKKDEFVAKAKTDLNALDAKIRELKKKNSSASGEGKSATQKDLDKLKQQRAVLAQKLKDARAATAENWDKAKAGFTNGYAQVKESVKDAWQRLADKVSK